MIFWGTDWDRLAGAIGKYLQTNPLEGTKVIEYKGNKDWPGEHNENISKTYEYIEDVPYSIIKRDRKKEQKFQSDYIKPFIKLNVNEYCPYFSIDLHSTLRKDLESNNEIEFDVFFCSMNDKGAWFIDDNFIQKKSNWNMPWFHTTQYHLYGIDISYIDKDILYDETIIKNTVEELNNFIQFMRVGYPKLWKKYKI